MVRQLSSTMLFLMACVFLPQPLEADRNGEGRGNRPVEQTDESNAVLENLKGLGTLLKDAESAAKSAEDSATAWRKTGSGDALMQYEPKLHEAAKEVAQTLKLAHEFVQQQVKGLPDETVEDIVESVSRQGAGASRELEPEKFGQEDAREDVTGALIDTSMYPDVRSGRDFGNAPEPKEELAQLEPSVYAQGLDDSDAPWYEHHSSEASGGRDSDNLHQDEWPSLLERVRAEYQTSQEPHDSFGERVNYDAPLRPRIDDFQHDLGAKGIAGGWETENTVYDPGRVDAPTRRNVHKYASERGHQRKYEADEAFVERGNVDKRTRPSRDDAAYETVKHPYEFSRVGEPDALDGGAYFRNRGQGSMLESDESRVDGGNFVASNGQWAERRHGRTTQDVEDFSSEREHPRMREAEDLEDFARVTPARHPADEYFSDRDHPYTASGPGEEDSFLERGYADISRPRPGDDS